MTVTVQYVLEPNVGDIKEQLYSFPPKQEFDTDSKVDEKK